ncbi:MAG: hypothetical protein DME58_07260 [Verrucomicrobia bacterium]|nr:MAG: hypothetical protein DME58_07260 [Verrucomicrobiota bacterium]
MRVMKTLMSLVTAVFATLIASSSFAQSPATSPATATGATAAQPATATGQPNPEEMMKQMMEMSKLNENHKLLADMNGSWNYTIKMWMSPDPTAQPQQSKGTASRKSAMGGRYFTMDVTGKLQMPGEDGKMKDMQFKGMAIEGYDNVKKKFVSSWIDNMWKSPTPAPARNSGWSGATAGRADSDCRGGCVSRRSSGRATTPVGATLSACRGLPALPTAISLICSAWI